MVQASITAWLRKPASVSKAAETSEDQSIRPNNVDSDHNSVQAAPLSSVEAQQASLSQPFTLPPLPKNVELVPLTEELIPGFKRLNSLTLPVPYSSSYYTESMTEPYHGITLMALWHPDPPKDSPSPRAIKPRLIGAIRCRLLPSANLYISTLGLLAPYRSHGIATHLLQRIVIKASDEHGVKCVTAHVWEANEEGLEWYKKRGFEILEKENGYYRKLKPNGAFLVRKWIGVGDLLGNMR